MITVIGTPAIHKMTSRIMMQFSLIKRRADSGKGPAK